MTVEKNSSVTRREYIVKMRDYNKGNLVTRHTQSPKHSVTGRRDPFPKPSVVILKGSYDLFAN